MNANLLKARMKELNKTQGIVAEASGMSENSLSRKLSGKRDFRLSEIERLCEVLNISDPRPFFFDWRIPNMQRTSIEPRAG